MVRADSSCIRHDRLSGSRAIDGRFVVHTFLWKETLLIKDEEQYEARDHDQRREHHYDQYGGERACRGRCCRESQIRRQHVRPLRYTQPRMMLATATMASKRAPREACRTNRTKATNPQTTERMTSARAR
jgi:hypothetical protein